jgi:hypothetical protein
MHKWRMKNLYWLASQRLRHRCSLNNLIAVLIFLSAAAKQSRFGRQGTPLASENPFGASRVYGAAMVGAKANN